MAFAEVRFPEDISYGSRGGPQFSTDVVVTHGGHEQRNSNWANARLRYNVAHGVRTQAQLDTLIAFFRARKGKAEGFRFKDWADYKALAQNIGTGNGVATTFQLKKNYTSGSASEVRDITKSISGTVNIYLNAVLQTSGVSINHNTGVVTFTSAPENGVVVTADFEFDVPVRFDTDTMTTILSSYGHYAVTDVPLVEVR